MSTYIIADLHLSEDEPAITAGFMNFIHQQAIHADSLYILGDFFNYWIGDDDKTPLHQQVANALTMLTERGIPCYFIHGNRDFLLGKRYAKQCGMTILNQETLLELYGKRVLILHGDTLCIDDQAYQNYRKKCIRLDPTPIFSPTAVYSPADSRKNAPKQPIRQQYEGRINHGCQPTSGD